MITDTTASIDTRGKTITTFILHAVVERLSAMAQGDRLVVITDDTEPIDNDLHAWARVTGNRIVTVGEGLPGRSYEIEKGPPPGRPRTVAMVISNPGLEELLSPLGFALAATLEGDAVALYIQGPAVRMLARGFEARLGGLMRPFSPFARRGLERIGHISPHDKIRQLLAGGARIYACGPSMEHFKVDRRELAFDGIIVSEYPTFMEIMRTSDVALFV